MSARGGLRWYAPRTVHGATAQHDLEGHASLGAALALSSDLVLAASLEGSWQGDDQHLLGLGLNLAAQLAETWRCVLGVTGTLPIDGLAAGRPLGLGLALTLVHTGG